MPTVQQLLSDPDFHRLPFEERIKVFDVTDPDFASLPTAEKRKAMIQLSPAAGPSAFSQLAPGSEERKAAVEAEFQRSEAEAAAKAYERPGYLESLKRLYGETISEFGKGFQKFAPMFQPSQGFGYRIDPRTGRIVGEQSTQGLVQAGLSSLTGLARSLGGLTGTAALDVGLPPEAAGGVEKATELGALFKGPISVTPMAAALAVGRKISTVAQAGKLGKAAGLTEKLAQTQKVAQEATPLQAGETLLGTSETPGAIAQAEKAARAEINPLFDIPRKNFEEAGLTRLPANTAQAIAEAKKRFGADNLPTAVQDIDQALVQSNPSLAGEDIVLGGQKIPGTQFMIGGQKIGGTRQTLADIEKANPKYAEALKNAIAQGQFTGAPLQGPSGGSSFRDFDIARQDLSAALFKATGRNKLIIGNVYKGLLSDIESFGSENEAAQKLIESYKSGIERFGPEIGQTFIQRSSPLVKLQHLQPSQAIAKLKSMTPEGITFALDTLKKNGQDVGPIQDGVIQSILETSRDFKLPGSPVDMSRMLADFGSLEEKGNLTALLGEEKANNLRDIAQTIQEANSKMSRIGGRIGFQAYGAATAGLGLAFGRPFQIIKGTLIMSLPLLSKIANSRADVVLLKKLLGTPALDPSFQEKLAESGSRWTILMNELALDLAHRNHTSSEIKNSVGSALQSLGFPQQSQTEP